MINVSPFVQTLNDRPIAIFGLGMSGLATLKALVAGGAKVFAWDDNQDSRTAAENAGATCERLDTDILAGCACLILSPGVPLTHPEPHDVVKAATEAGTEIIGDIEILHRCLKNQKEHGHKTIGITGTNGKSTTTALVTHTLNACGISAIMGGNIGVPVLQMDPPTPDTVFVLEMSSYQIDLCPTFRPDIGILLNITPDHINRHGSFENYVAIKHRMLDGAGHAINAEALDQSVLDGHSFPHLPGDHNKQNIIAVLAVCDYMGVDRDKAIAAIKTFPGLPHRQFLVRVIDGVGYINDSKATNAEAASKALSSHNNIYWIVGGQEKEGGLDGLEIYKDRIKHAFLIGESCDNFALWLEDRGIDFTPCQTLDKALPAAHEVAQNNKGQPGGAGVVLLSPACASWDQFKSFEHRGDTFTKLVEALK